MPDVRRQRGVTGRLREIFAQSLASAPPPGEGTICALPIPGFEEHRLGRNKDGAVCLVIAAPAAGGAARPDVRLQNLRIQRRVLCDVLRPTGERESLVGTIIACSAESQDLRGFFLDLFDQALSAIGQAPEEKEVDWWIDQATRLFAELETPAVREIRGLWGELLMICEASDAVALIRRWHDSPEDRYDFLAGSFALEVKTCNDSERVHLFSLSQVRPTVDMEVIVASVPVRPDPHGMSVLDLLVEIEGRLTDTAILGKLRQTVFRIGGGSLAQSPQRFDRRAAAEGVRLMWASAIPAIDERPPAEVLDVQLRIRCRDVAGEDLGKLIESRLAS
jgi:putative PD-(D/E)XK family protein DUF4420